MRSNNGEISVLRARIVTGNVLLDGEAKLAFVSKLNSPRTLSYILGTSLMLNNVKMRHGSCAREWRSVK